MIFEQTPRRRLQQRGVTLLEAMAVVMILALGILGVTFLVSQSVRQNRRSLTAAQAQMIAEWKLEQIMAEGCSRVVIYTGNPCHNIKRLDNTVDTVWWSSSGSIVQGATAPTPGPNEALPRRYTVAIDVDGAGTDPVSGNALFEGTEQGSPRLDTFNGTAMNLLNVRVTVSWDSPGFPTQAVVLQSRITP